MPSTAPILCDFYTPALVNRAPVAVAIGSEGTGPVSDADYPLENREPCYPGSTGSLARLAALYRGAVDRLVPRGAPRRRFWREFFLGGVASAINTGDVSGARRLATRMLKTREAETGSCFTGWSRTRCSRSADIAGPAPSPGGRFHCSTTGWFPKSWSPWEDGTLTGFRLASQRAAIRNPRKKSMNSWSH